MTATVCFPAGTGNVAEIPPVTIDYFFEAGCGDCGRVRDHVIPALRERFAGCHVVNMHDLHYGTNVLLLTAYQERFCVKANEPVCMVVDCKRMLNGYRAIATGLTDQVDLCLAERYVPGWRPTDPPEPDKTVLRKRAEAFTLPMMVVYGLGDGINPCAISTLLFLVSYLGVAGITGRRLLVVGGVFCAATFVTYFAIGMGIAHTLRQLTVFPWLRMGLDMLMVSVLLVLAGMSFLDARRFRKTGSPGDVTLRVPDSIRDRIHGTIRSGMRARHILPATAAVAIIVTLLESVCTGQLYVPAMVCLVKSGVDPVRYSAYLAVYNLAFTVPLAVIVLLSWYGVSMKSLLEWSRSHVVTGKVLLGILFVALAVLIAVF